VSFFENILSPDPKHIFDYPVNFITLHPFPGSIMPLKNNRNSRDDKSKKVVRSSKSSIDFASKTREKPEQTDDLNSSKGKLFENNTDRPLKIGFRARDNNPKLRGRKNSDKSSDNIQEGRAVRSRGQKTETGNRKIWNKSAGPKDERPPSRYGRSDTGKPFKKDYKSKSSFSSDDRNRSSAERPQAKYAKRSRKSEEKPADGLIRLNRYIANAGICSRRKADELIQAGVVSVNGEIISQLGTRIDAAKDIVRYNGETLRREKMVYVLLNKPKDYITTTDDPQERRTVMQLVEKASRERIYPVGRLDRNTTGLLLMTNDGALAEKLSHPRNNITKIYHVELNKSLSQGDLNKIAFGLELEDGLIKPDAISYVQGGSKREIGIQIHSGKNHIVRRIFEHLGYEVIKLDRVIYGNLTKKDLGRGRWRYLEEKEIIQLKHLIK
jgi:23S rRNA pseudouridine2605 synthase